MAGLPAAPRIYRARRFKLRQAVAPALAASAQIFCEFSGAQRDSHFFCADISLTRRACFLSLNPSRPASSRIASTASSLVLKP